MKNNPFDLFFEQQKKYYYSGKTRSLSFRKEALKKLRAAILMHEEEIYEALYKDLHKSKFESFTTEIGFVLEELSFVLKNLKGWMKPKRVTSGIINFPAKSYIYQEPLGTVLIIAPWNYPFQLLIAPLIGAIASGNTAILKPSEISENTSNVLERIINSTFEKEYVHVVNGGVEVAQQLMHLKVDHLFFTGSTHIGKIIMQAAAKNLVPVTLELGGKSPCIVDKNVNVRLTAKRIIWGKLLNAGQTCIAPDYLMVHEKVKDDLVTEMKRFIQKFYGKNPLENEEYPRIISEANVERLAVLLEGTHVLHGGDYRVKEHYFSPTIMDDVDFESKVMQQEIFGPLLPIITFNDIDTVIESINNRPKPLALYVFSDDQKFKKKDIQKVFLLFFDWIH